ncbi:MAG: PmbA/TldA family metallopeptidase, partial [Gemmatimonadaceae bacterium]
MTSRRDFVKTVSAVAVGAPLISDPLARALAPRTRPSVGDPLFRELTMVALDAARGAGAQYADVRISSRQDQGISTRERRVQGLQSSETFGFGVRVLVDGAWGFVASNRLNRDEIAAAARAAVAQARANRAAQLRPHVLAPVTPVGDVEWHSPARIDPFTVSIDDKVGLLLRANEAALAAGARFVNSSMQFVKDEKTLATTDGSFIVQTFIRSQPTVTVTAVKDGDFQTRMSTEIQPMGLGYEHVLDG